MAAGVAAEYKGRVGLFDCATGEFRPREALTREEAAQEAAQEGGCAP